MVARHCAAGQKPSSSFTSRYIHFVDSLETLCIQKEHSVDNVILTLQCVRPDFWSLEELQLGFSEQFSVHGLYSLSDSSHSIDLYCEAR